MFGNLRAKRGPYGTPGIGDGLPGAIDPANMDFGMQTQIPRAEVGMEQPAAKPSFMGQGGAGRAIAGTIGDTLLQYNGMDAVYAPQQAAQQKAAMDAQQAQADRETKFADWRRQYDYQRENPEPSAAQPYRFEDNAGNVYERDAATGQNRLIFTDPNDKQFIQDGQLVKVTNVVRQQQQQGAQSPTVLGRDLPQGWTVQGGPASQAPGNFRR